MCYCYWCAFGIGCVTVMGVGICIVMCIALAVLLVFGSGRRIAFIISCSCMGIVVLLVLVCVVLGLDALVWCSVTGIGIGVCMSIGRCNANDMAIDMIIGIANVIGRRIIVCCGILLLW